LTASLTTKFQTRYFNG